MNLDNNPSRQDLLNNIYLAQPDLKLMALLLRNFGDTLLIEDIQKILTIEGIDRETSFMLADIALNKGLKNEPIHALAPFLQTKLIGREINIYFESLVAVGDGDRLMDLYRHWYENEIYLENKTLLPIIMVLNNNGEIDYLSEILDNQMDIQRERGKHPIDSNRKLFRAISGENLYGVQLILGFDDQNINFKIAKALNRNGRHDEAREKVLPYCMAGIPDAMAIYVNSFTFSDFSEGRTDFSLDWIQILRNSTSRSFQAIALRVAAFQAYLDGDIEKAIDKAQRAAYYDDDAAHFLIHVLGHNREIWIRILRKRSTAKLEVELENRFGRAPTSDLDSKIVPGASKSIKQIRADILKESPEELWECRYALFRRDLNLSNGEPHGTWEELVCREHVEGLKRLQERSLLPLLASPIWDMTQQLDWRDYVDLDLAGYQDFRGRKLWNWQSEALSAWTRHGRIGLIEAATGSGKSEVGIAVAKDAIDQGKAVVLVVPRKLLQDQWRKNFIKAGMGSLIDTFGGDWHSPYPRAGKAKKGRVLIALVQSLSKYPAVIPEKGQALLIADEVHLYTGTEYRKILSEDFRWRIGLTATLPDSIEDRNLLRNYFAGDPVYVYSIPKAISDKVILPYEVLLIRVKPTPEEEEQLRRHALDVQSCFKELIRLEIISRDFNNFDQEIAKLEELERFPEITRKYRHATAETDKILAHFSSNGNAVQLLAPLFKSRGKSLIFSDFVRTMEKTVDVLTTATVKAEMIDGTVVGEEREYVIDQLKSGSISVVVSPQAMDVGVDIPELEVGMYVGVRRERLNLIQRLGRFLRINEGKKLPVICIPVAIGHNDDPLMPENENMQKSAFNYVVEHALKPINLFDINDAVGIEDFIKSRV